MVETVKEKSMDYSLDLDQLRARKNNTLKMIVIAMTNKATEKKERMTKKALNLRMSKILMLIKTKAANQYLKSSLNNNQIKGKRPLLIQENQ